MTRTLPQPGISGHWLTLLMIIAALFATAPQAAALELSDDEQAWIARQQTITVGGERDWAPFDFVDGEGNYTGIAKAYLDILSEQTGLQIKMEIDDWDRLLTKIKAGQIDLLPAIYYSRQRERFVNFSESYSKHAEFIFVREGQKHFSSLEQLHGKRVVVVKGYTIEAFLKKNHPEITVTTEPSILRALNALLTGKADALINDIASTSHVAHTYNITGFEPTVLLEERINELRMATRKGAAPLTRIINKVFQGIDADTHRRIQKRWITLTPQKTKTPQLVLTPKEKSWLELHPIIRCTSDPSWMPYEGRDESGNFIGIFSDITELISQRLAITIDYIPSKSWDEVIRRARHKEVDFITAIPSQKRQEFLRFTSPIIVKELALLTRKSHPIISSFSSFPGNKVAMITGYGYNQEVLKKYPEHDYVYVASLKEGLYGLSSNRYDIFIANITSSLYYISKEMLNDLQVAGTLDISFAVAYGVRDDWQIFHAILEKALRSISDEERQEILNRWVRVDVVQKVDYSLLYQLGGFFVLIVLIILYWNRRMHREIKRREQVESALHKSNEEIQTILDTAQNIIIVSDSHKLLNTNQALLDFFGYPSLEDFFQEHRRVCELFIRHDDYFHLGRIDDPDLWISAISKLPETEQLVSMQGKHTIFPSVFSVHINQLDASDVFVISFTDITGIKLESKEHEYRSTHDQLTGIYNRLYLNRYLKHELQRCKQLNEPVSVILLDIDFFKQVNDTYGHSAGDEVLKELSTILNANIRASDKAARWGGEEFLVVLTGTDLEQALFLAEKLRRNIAAHLFTKPQRISCSFGVATAQKGDTMNSLIKRADRGLYQAKERGRNRVEVIGEEAGL